MSTAAPALMTMEELLAMPDDGVERELIDGQLREYPIDDQLRERPMTMRNRRHSVSEARVAMVLGNWLDQQPEPRGEIVVGEAGFRLRRDPDTCVGIDVAYVSAELLAATPAEAAFWEGPPTLAVEILSPSDRHLRVNEKLRAYLDAGVPLVWLIDPVLRTVLVLRPEAEPELFNVRQELAAEPHLPGFRVAVARLFAD